MPNSFYRFQPAWNAGFYPDNQITANLLNALAGNIGAWLPGFFPGKTLSQLVAGVTGQMNVFNVSPYFGGFTLTYQEIFDTPNYEYNINIRNADLSATDNTQVVTINGFFNFTTKEVLNATVEAFIPGSYSGSFDYSPIPVESEVDRALQIVEQNGSAFFPLTYSFDSGSNIATSGLARGKNWQLDSSGNSTRLPADTLPKQNARTFSVAPQTAEDRYCISLMEKVINFSLTETDYTLIEAYFNTFTIPDGWTASFAVSLDTYNRIFCLLYRDDRSLLMIGRLDTYWLWQRFINESGSSDLSVFNYLSTTPLPYLPVVSYQWLYGDWYDMEFVNFTAGCYESPEFYAMPAIPGDNWQFNVPSDSGNLTGLTTASVGLFSQDGQFIQQVGEAINPPCCFEMLLAYQTVAGANPNFIAWFDLIEGINTFYSGIQFQFSNQTVNYLGTTASSQITADLTDFILEIPAPLPYDRQDFIDLMASQSWGYGITVTGELINNGPFEGVKIKFCNFEDSPFSSIVAFYNNPGSGENVYQSYINSLCCPKSQFQATTLIPAIAAGCYRLGLYAESEGGFYLYSLSNIINIDGSDCFSTMLEFWANDNSIAQGFEYFNDWKQRVRLGINGGGAKPVIEENLYRQSNGVHRRPQNKQDLSLDLHTDFIDEQTQLALVDATRHPYLVWNNKSIFVKGDLDVATVQDFTTQSSFETLAQVKFSALLQGFQPKNSSCLTC
jgi:hypothetical protein